MKSRRPNKAASRLERRKQAHGTPTDARKAPGSLNPHKGDGAQVGRKK